MSKEIGAHVAPEHKQFIHAEKVARDKTSIGNCCQNCGAQLNGKFCHHCGQSSRSMIKFFGEVVKELLDDIFGYDSRLKHSLVPLLFVPGKLTLEYIKGKRFFYVMPFRFYLFTSLIFILSIQLTTDFSQLSSPNTDQNKITNESPASRLRKVEKDPQQKEANSSRDNFGILWDEGELKYQGIEVGEEGIFKDVMDEINAKANGLIKDPKPFIDELFQLLPYMMFVLLPVFAIFLKLTYVFQRRFYVEHLVFLLHNHSYLFTAILIALFLDWLQSYFATLVGWFASFGLFVTEWLAIALLWWMVIYIFVAAKRVYRQSWFMTISKTLTLSIIYLSLLSVGFVITLFIGAYFA